MATAAVLSTSLTSHDDPFFLVVGIIRGSFLKLLTQQLIKKRSQRIILGTCSWQHYSYCGKMRPTR